MNNLSVRLYNIPSNMTLPDLETKLTDLSLVYNSLALPTKPNDPSQHLGYALVTFNDQQSFDAFANAFHKLRHNILSF